jgi:hypothetical protein
MFTKLFDWQTLVSAYFYVAYSTLDLLEVNLH